MPRSSVTGVQDAAGANVEELVKSAKLALAKLHESLDVIDVRLGGVHAVVSGDHPLAATDHDV